MFYYKKKRIDTAGNPELIASIEYENNAGLRAIDTTGFSTVAPAVSGTAFISSEVVYGSDPASLRVVGTAGGLRFTSSKGLNIRNDSFTIGGWMRSGGGSFHYIIGDQTDLFYPLQYYLGAWYIGDAQVNALAHTDTAPAAGTWVHMAMSHDAPTHTYRLFKNGVLVKTTVGTVLRDATITSWEMGGRSFQSLYGLGNYGRVTIMKNFVQTSNFTPT